jgi:hypothetical protein
MSDFGELPAAWWMQPVHVSVGTDPFGAPIERFPAMIHFRDPSERAPVDVGEQDSDSRVSEDGRGRDAVWKQCNFNFVGQLFGRFFGGPKDPVSLQPKRR